MERTFWTDERLDSAFEDLRREMRTEFADVRHEMRDGFRELRGQMAQTKFAMLGGYAAIVAALIATSA